MSSTRRSLIGQSLRFAALASTIGIKGCSKSDQPGRILYVTLELGNAFYAEMIEGLNRGINNTGRQWQLDVRTGKSLDDATGQIDVMEAYITQRRLSGLAGLILVPAQSGPELASTVRKYNEAKIPVINVDVPIIKSALESAQATVSSFIGSNNLEGGREAADLMFQGLPDGGNVLLLLGASGNANAQNRRRGFTDRMSEIEKRTGKLFKLHEWNCNFSPSEATSATSSILASGTPIRGVFAASDGMALGAVQAVNSSKRENQFRPLIIGYDATPEARRAIETGEMFGSISQNPGVMGETAIEYLKTIIEGGQVPEKTVIPVSTVKRH